MRLFLNPYNLSKLDGTNLVGLYFSQNDEEMNGNAVWSLWKMTASIPKEDLLENWLNIKDLWKWRVNEFVLTGYSNEFFLEFQWFSYILLETPKAEGIDSLKSLLEPFLYFIDRHVIWMNLEKFLANQSEKYPEQTIKYYRLMHEKRIRPEFGLYDYGEESDKIILSAIKDYRTRKDALAVINIVGRFNQRYQKYMNNTPNSSN